MTYLAAVAPPVPVPSRDPAPAPAILAVAEALQPDLAQGFQIDALRLRLEMCRVALKSGTRRVGQRVLPLNVTFMRQLVGVFPCFAVRSGQLQQEDGALLQTHEARQLLRAHRGQC
jgi:hypothetical protein